MKAMIFAAGLGTRLKPLTDTMPKAMVPIGGKPLIQHIIEKLKTAQFNEIIINVHHFADQIIDFVRTNNSFDVRIEFSDECNQLLDTGGGIKKASWFFDDNQPFLIHNVDILSNVNLVELYASHQKSDVMATLLANDRKTSRYLLFNDENRLCGWINKQTDETKSPFSSFNPVKYHELAFSGIHVLSPAVFSLMNDFSDRFSIIDFYLSVCDKVDIRAYAPDNISLLDVGKIDSLKEAEEMVK
ncbi:MAG: nucleotidyltransferase family protein [Dysgonamonadaceae bacterium]|jgi:NDP-sugar pyrophosphorylase family protein|nr:nucleotidyltransferase family protein [Dysgonamonadaceae bacterium]